jgi:hydroxymethylpyrimidine/phosphomethylpyrimidine kinase
MSASRSFVLTIAGFDPSGGAGVLADVKTFEQHRVYGFAINTGNTIQTENEFCEMQWTDLDFVLRSIQVLFKTYPIKAVKIGIVPSLDYLKEIVFEIKKLAPETKIVWDTVLKSTTEFNFLDIDNHNTLFEILEKIDLITPNFEEVLQLQPSFHQAEAAAKKLSTHCPVLLKGGHNSMKKGVDFLYLSNEIYKFDPIIQNAFAKHGSGCVLSASITAHLALEKNLKDSCLESKKYIETYLQSCLTKLGFHYV